jgi:hypothetical protein
MVNRDDLNAYLLHEMPEAEREAFAERWFADPDLYEQLRMAEADLLDAYARGEASLRQREQIERYLLDSKAQREKLAFARALHRALPGPARSAGPRWRVMAAAVAALACGAVGAWVARDNFTPRRETARVARPDAANVYTVTLASDTLRGASPEPALHVPPGTALVRLEVELDSDDDGKGCSATISRAGTVVWTEAPLQPELRGGVSVLDVWTPARVLTPGNYSLKLQADGRALAYYEFAVGP